MKINKEPTLSDNLAKELYEVVQSGHIYDEVGNSEYGWFGLLIYQRKPYIISYKDDNFSYKEFSSEESAKKAWDHVCIKFEAWFQKKNEYIPSYLSTGKQSKSGTIQGGSVSG